MPNPRVAVVYANHTVGPAVADELFQLITAKWIGAKVYPPLPVDASHTGLAFPPGASDVMELMVTFLAPAPSAALAGALLQVLHKLPRLKSLVVLATSVTQQSNTAQFVSPLARGCRATDIALTVIGAQEGSQATMEQFVTGLARKWSERCSKRQRLHQTFVKTFRLIGSDADYHPLRIPGSHRHEFSSALVVRDTATQPGFVLWSSQWCPTPEIEGKKNANTEWKVAAGGAGGTAPPPLDKARVLDVLNRMNEEASRPATQELRALYKLRNHEAVLWDILSEFHGEAAEELFYCCLPNNHTRQLCGFFTRGMRKLDRTVRDVLIRHPEVVYHYGGTEDMEPMAVDNNHSTSPVDPSSSAAAAAAAASGQHPPQLSAASTHALMEENRVLRAELAERDSQLKALQEQFSVLQLQHRDLVELTQSQPRELDLPAEAYTMGFDPLPIRPIMVAAGGEEMTRDLDANALRLTSDVDQDFLLNAQPDPMADTLIWGNAQLEIIDSSSQFRPDDSALGSDIFFQTAYDP